MFSDSVHLCVARDATAPAILDVAVGRRDDPALSAGHRVERPLLKDQDIFLYLFLANCRSFTNRTTLLEFLTNGLVYFSLDGFVCAWTNDRGTFERWRVAHRTRHELH